MNTAVGCEKTAHPYNGAFLPGILTVKIIFFRISETGGKDNVQKH